MDPETETYNFPSCVGDAVTEREKADVHVMPVDDLREHDGTRDCWCQPALEQDEEHDAMIVIHHAADGRELVEQYGLQ